jgi:AraC-like DNA-binding protein
MERPLLLWIDLLSTPEDTAVRELCARHFRVVVYSDGGSATDDGARLQAAIDTHQPALLCFDFDFPLESQLQLMQTIKRRNPGLLVLMLTVDHSEALAVWSFRARVWNYLVKPVPEQEMRANLAVLLRIASVGVRQRREVRLPGPAVAQIGKPNRAAMAYQAVMPAIRHVEKCYGETISAEQMAKLCGMSPFRFSREFRRATGNTFQDYVLRYRVNEACRLLRNDPDKPISAVGSAAGFSDSSYFARIFKRYMNVRPSDYMRERESRRDAALVGALTPLAVPVEPDDAVPMPQRPRLMV